MNQWLSVTLILGEGSAVCANYNVDAEKKPFATLAFGGPNAREIVVHFRLEDRAKLRELGTEALRLSFDLDRDAAQREADERAARERDEAAAPREAPVAVRALEGSL